MKIILLTCQSANERWSEIASDLYTQKISAFVNFEIVRKAPKKNSRENSEQKKKSDSELLMSTLKTDDYVILLDERGSSLSSEDLSKKIELAQNSSKKRIVFIIGGAFGVTEELMSRAQLKVSLSKMVFNHLVAEVVALEQIYRGYTILRNLPYHNQ